MVASTISMVDFIIRAGINGVDRNQRPSSYQNGLGTIVMKILATLLSWFMLMVSGVATD